MSHFASSLINIGTSGTPSLVSGDNPLPITTQNEGAFGETIVAPLTPYIQATGVYNTLPANMITYTATGGSVSYSNGEMVCQTGTSVGGYGVLRSVRSVNYKGGMGAIFRGTGRFTTGVANSIQGVGFFNVGDAYLFGYYGADYGIIYQHSGKPEVRTLTITGAAGGATSATVVLNGVSFTIPLTVGTVNHNAYEIATYLTANQTVFTCRQNGATVVINATTDGAKSGTYSFSHATATASWAQNAAGVTKTTDFFARANWNIDTCSWLVPTKGNVYQIKCQYLGYGAIKFYVEDPSTGRFKYVHQIVRANAYTEPTVTNPSMHAGVFAASLGSTTNLTAVSACVAAFIEGTPGRTRNPRSYSNNKSIGTTLTNIFSVRNRDVFNSVYNQVEIELLQLTVFTDSSKGAKIVIYASPTLAGEPDWTFLSSSNLVSEIDVAGTTVTGGTPLFEMQIAGNSSTVINLDNLRTRIPPGYYITVAGNVNSGAASVIGAGLSWYEDL